MYWVVKRLNLCSWLDSENYATGVACNLFSIHTLINIHALDLHTLGGKKTKTNQQQNDKNNQTEVLMQTTEPN